MGSRDDELRCPDCGAPLDAGRSDEDCPACLMRLAVGKGSDDPTLERPSACRGEAETALPTVPGYRIERALGEGGMGRVYLAEQLEPLRRHVAVKVIKRGLDTHRVVRRFEVERQALARMDHPSIARVFDAGETADGRPFFAMEWVDGEPLTRFCDRRRIPIAGRLELFVAVCDAVQHAHFKGIAHRDLKPSNILVVEGAHGRPVPKIIDFGIAKALESPLTERTFFTEMGVLVGTPEYMSPEQAGVSALDVDTRTDVYSLGVLLYQLLVGELPLDARALRASGYEEICRKIRQEDPPLPSSRVTEGGERSASHAVSRRTDTRSLQRRLRGDLDWIVMKALEKDPERRYQGSAELAADIGRHLRNEPVIARAPSAGYRLSKFVRRHRLGVSAAVVALAGLVVFAIAMALLADRIADERDRANREREITSRVSTFMTDMLSDIDPRVMGEAMVAQLDGGILRSGRDRGTSEAEVAAARARLRDAVAGVNTTEAARRLLDESVLSSAGESLEGALEDDPEIAARLRLTLAKAYQDLGLLDEALPFAEEAITILRDSLGPDAPEALSAGHRKASILGDLGKWGEAEELYRKQLDRQRRILGDRHADTLDSLNGLGLSLNRQRRFEEAEPLLREAMEGRIAVLGRTDPHTLASRNNYAVLLLRLGRFEDAERQFRLVLQDHLDRDGPQHADTLNAISNLGVALYNLERYDEAEPFYRDALEGFRVAMGSDHPKTAVATNNMAKLLERLGRPDEAESHYRDAVRRFRAGLGEDHPNTVVATTNLGTLLLELERFAEAEATLSKAVAAAERVFGAEHARTVRARETLARALRAQGRASGGE